MINTNYIFALFSKYNYEFQNNPDNDKFCLSFHNFIVCTKLLHNDIISKGVKMILESDIIANRIKKFREASKLTQEQLGEKINLSRNEVSNLECGNNKLSYKTLRELCDALDICPCELMCGADHKTISDDTIDLIKHMDSEDQIIIHQMVLVYKETKDELKKKK